MPVPTDPTAGRPGSSGAGGLGSAVAAAAVDELNIHPLDVAGALQILVAEVRAALSLPIPTGAPPATAAGAPLLLLQLLLKRLPDDEKLEPAVWLSAATQAETSLRVGMDKAIDVVLAWHDVPAVVVDAARDARAVVLGALNDEPPNPLWLRPEWMGLAPRMQRFWRRRRHARRNLHDPDWHAQEREA